VDSSDVGSTETVGSVKVGACLRLANAIVFFYAWRRERGEAFSIKLNTMPIGSHWNGLR